jgi:hypothetical protein
MDPTEKQLLSRTPHLALPPFDVPPYLDATGKVMRADDQGNEPACAGYAAAGLVEVDNWALTGQANAADARGIYGQAKLDDEYGNQPGTTLDNALKAAIKVGAFIREVSTVDVKVLLNKQEVIWALLQYDVCLLGFETSESWQYADSKTGYLHKKRGKSLGGHAVLGAWFDVEGGIGFVNSWGVGWGHNGMGRMTHEQFERDFLYGAVLAWDKAKPQYVAEFIPQDNQYEAEAVKKGRMRMAETQKIRDERHKMRARLKDKKKR